MQRLVFALAAIALAAGTFGGESVSSGGTESTFVGAYYATK